TGSGVRVAATAGTIYRIAVDDALLYNGDIPANTVVLHWSFGTPPANDSFASAAALSGAQGSVSGTTVAARAEPGEPPHGERASGASVWYAWTAAATGNVTFSLSTDGLVAVYRGTAVDALAVVRRSDDGGDATRTVTVAVDAGSDYRIAVDGLRGDTGPFTLTWSGGAAPANDAFSSAQALSGASGTALAATDGATKEAGEPDH